MSPKKNKTVITVTPASEPPDTSRGSPLWGLNRLREDALVRLMEDLVDHEETGLTAEQVEVVSRALQKLLVQASALPDKAPFTPTIMASLELFAKRFENWSEITGNGEESVQKRRKALRNMRTARKKLAEVIRVNQAVLAENLDLQWVKSMYEILAEIPTAFPSLFLNLAEAVARFAKVIAGLP